MKRTLNLFKTGALALGVMFALYSCNNATDSTATDDNTEQADTTASAPAAQGPTDPQIASIAVTANQVDIDYAKIAADKATDPKVKEFAATMAKDHQAVIDLAVALANKLGVTPEDNPTTQALLHMEDSTKQVLNGASAADFDKTYIDNEVGYHEFAINAVENILIPSAQNEELKALLQQALPNFKHHLEMAKEIQASLNK